MDLVYVCKPGQENDELKYSIRSAVENLPHDNIWVIGGKPGWYTGNFIKTSRKINKYDTVRENLRIACNDSRISDDFILMNDDFFILKPVTGNEVWHSGSFPTSEFLQELAAIRENQYHLMLRDVRESLVYLGIDDPKNYELHIPMIMNKQKLLKILDHNVLWRSMYGNVFNVGGNQMEDVKVRIEGIDALKENNFDLSNQTYLSTEDNVSKEIIKNVLSKMFPNKTKYE